MKRLAVLTLSAVVLCGAATARGADPLPLPTGFAPTTPSVPVPTLKNGVVMPVAATAAPTAGAVQMVGFRSVGSVPAGDWTRGASVWCNDCAPAVRHPLPPAPVSCATGGCGGGHDGSCWEKFKNWFCYRQTPIHLGLTPTPRMTPLYTYFPCTERAGCGDGNCGPGGCFAGHARHGALIGGRGCTTCPTPGESVMPGFRFANPTVGAPAPQPVAAPQSEVLQTGFRHPGQPAPAVPYRPAAR